LRSVFRASSLDNDWLARPARASANSGRPTLKPRATASNAVTSVALKSSALSTRATLSVSSWRRRRIAATATNAGRAIKKPTLRAAKSRVHS
jgi:hypothetical protein